MNRQEPAAGLTYPVALHGAAPRDLALGLAGAVLGLVVLVSLVSQAVLRAGWLLRGQPNFETYRTAALAYELPDGVIATHLGLAAMIPLVLAILRYFHGRTPRWAISVQPGVRWRYLLICLVIAAIVLNAFLWLTPGRAPVLQAGQPDWPIYLSLILVTSPLQAAAEEYFFRGYLMQAIGSLAGRAWAGILVSALVFALLHGSQNPALFAHRLGFGLIAGALVYVTGGLEASIAAHVINNVLAFSYAAFTGGIAALKAMTEVSWSISLSDLAAFAGLAAVVWWIGRAMNVATTTPEKGRS